MKARTVRIAVFSIIWVLGLAVIGAGALYWRLSQGPISLAFLGSSIEDAINRQLSGMTIKLGETEIELDTVSHTPTVRARNLVLADQDGTVLASAPKAGVALDATRLMRGVVSVTALELIGPKVSAKRNLDGSVAFGIQSEAASPDQEVFVDASETGEFVQPGDAALAEGQPAPAAPVLSGRRLLNLLDAGGKDGTLSLLEEVRISRGAVRFFDEANDATWFAPQADLAFRRTEGGFVIAGKASVSSGGEPWRIEAAATYRRSSNNYTANISVENLIPAHVAQNIFALSQFARVSVPFSGHVEIEAQETGSITRAAGQMFAGKGNITLPDYLANNIDIEEASLRATYEGPGTPITVAESSILMTGSRADVKGTFLPKYESDGRLSSIAFDLKSENASVDTGAKDPIFVDKVDFKGTAFTEQQKIEIGDLVVMAGNTGVRLRGVITGGDMSPGINVAGRLRDVSSALLKKLWPPVLAPRTRTWINENIEAGRISDGTFQVNFAPNQLAQAQAAKQLPDNVVDVRFNMTGVRSKYFKSMPVLQQASGNAHLKDGHFQLIIDEGFVDLPSGEKAQLARGQFDATELLTQAVQGKFSFDVRGSVPGLLELASQPDLKLSGGDFKALPPIKGKAQALIGLQLPLIKNVPKNLVKLTTDVKLSDVSLANVMQGVDLTDGQFAVKIEPDTVSVGGPAKLNGISSQIAWEKPRGGGAAKIELETVVDGKLRAKLGIKLDDYISGDVPVKATVLPAADGGRKIKIDANLSDVDMRIAAIGWSRGAVKGTKASFIVTEDGDGNRSIEELAVDGAKLKLRGRVSLNKAGGFRLLDFSEIRVSDDDVFRAKLAPGDDGLHLAVSGTSFDARPYIKKMVSPSKSGEGGEGGNGPKYIIDASFDSVTAHRGEEIKNARATLVARGSQITSATIEGVFLSGLPITIRLTPVEGGRELRVASADGGSTLRATNFYSKIAGGQLEFYALMANAPGSPIRNGELKIKRFDVRNEAAIAELDSRGRPKKSGPRKEGVSFKRLVLPFTTDAKFIRMCGIELKGDSMGGVAGGLIRKADGAIDLTGTMIPAQGINGFLDDVPLLGQILTGGDNEGVFGVTFAMGGTVSNPKTQVNPMSALLPGVFRKFSEFRGACSKSKGGGQN